MVFSPEMKMPTKAEGSGKKKIGYLGKKIQEVIVRKAETVPTMILSPEMQHEIDQALKQVLRGKYDTDHYYDYMATTAAADYSASCFEGRRTGIIDRDASSRSVQSAPAERKSIRPEFAFLPFSELIMEVGGVEYFLDHREDYADLDSADMMVFLSELPIITSKKIIDQAMGCFGQLDNLVVSRFIGYHWYPLLIKYQNQFDLIDDPCLENMIIDRQCTEEFFIKLLPRMKVPVDDRVLVRFLKVGNRNALLRLVGPRLSDHFNPDYLKELSVKNDCLAGYINLYSIDREVFQNIINDDDLLVKLIEVKAMDSVITYMRVRAMERNFRRSDALAILKFLKETGDFSLESTLFDLWRLLFDFASDQESVDFLLDRGYEDLARKNLSKFSNLNKKTAIYFIEHGYVEALFDYGGNFDRSVWDKELLMKMAEERKSRPHLVNLPTALKIGHIIPNGDRELMDQFIAVGWGGAMMEMMKHSASERVTFTSDQFDRMLQIYLDEKSRLDDHNNQPRRERSDDTPPIFNMSSSVDFYLTQIVHRLHVLPFKLTERQVQIIWDANKIEPLVRNVNMITPSFFTPARMDYLLSDCRLADAVHDHIDEFEKFGILKCDAQLFERLSTQVNWVFLWESRKRFTGLKYDEKMADALLVHGLESRLIESLDEFESLGIEVYEKIFTACHNKSAVKLEDEILKINKVLGRKANKIFETMNLNDASDMAAGIPGYGRINLHEEQYKRWDEFIDKTCIKRLDGLYKLLAINSFQAADYWLLGFHRPGAHVDVIRLCNQRLVDLVTQREWNNVVSLLEVMKKNKVAVDKYMLARDPDLVKVLVNEGPIVSDKTERRQLEFMLGMRSSGYEVSNRLASIPANKIRLDRLLNKFARREAAKDWQRRETVTEWPISSDKVKDVVNEIGIFYIREYVRTVVEQVESTLNANGQEFTPAVKMRINEAINQGSLAMSMRDYLVTVINDELEHGPTSRLSMIQRRSGESNRETVRHFMAHSSPEEVINFLDRAEESYRDEIEWSSLPEFGGKKWADVVKWTKKLIIAQTTNNDHALRHAMDTIFSLEHNTASVLNKDYEGYFIGRLDNIKPLLDAKFKSVNLAQDVRLIFQYVSMSTADKMMQILAVLQDLPGYDFANHRINPYANWRTVRGAKPQGD